MKHIDKYADLTGKRLTGEITPEEQAELSSWLATDGENQSFSDGLEEVWKLSGKAANEAFETDMTKAWAKIDAALDRGSSSGQVGSSAKIVPLSKRLGRWSMAAAVLALLAAGVWWMNQNPVEAAPVYVEVLTGEGERKDVTLPDGSTIAMNENTLLSYPENFAERNVNLEGEAFFKVERMEDSPFTITSGDATTTVLGTSFNVRAYPEEADVEVTVKTGKVALALKEKKTAPVILEAGASGVFKKAEVKVEKVELDHANADAWRTMKLEFDDVLMKDVISTLERYFNAEISVENEMIFECTYTSEFDKPDLNGILYIIGSTIGFEVENNNGKYLLKGEGCHPDN